MSATNMELSGEFYLLQIWDDRRCKYQTMPGQNSLTLFSNPATGISHPGKSIVCWMGRPMFGRFLQHSKTQFLSTYRFRNIEPLAARHADLERKKDSSQGDSDSYLSNRKGPQSYAVASSGWLPDGSTSLPYGSATVPTGISELCLRKQGTQLQVERRKHFTFYSGSKAPRGNVAGNPIGWLSPEEKYQLTRPSYRHPIRPIYCGFATGETCGILPT